MNPPAEITERTRLLGCIDEEVVCVGGRCHRQKNVLLFLSSRKNSNYLHAKKRAVQEAFDDKIH
jgi:hypothetical protein